MAPPEPRNAAGAPKADELLSVQGLRLEFDGVKALNGASFRLEEGQIGGLIGPNGAGKTTLFNCISGLYKANSGWIRLNGRDIVGVAPHRITGMGVSRTYQNLGLFSSLTVLENVLLGGHWRMHAGFAASAFGLKRVRNEEQHYRAVAVAVLEEFDLAEYAKCRVEELPYGTLKRVEIARALVSDASLLMLDEPAGGLSQAEVALMGELIAHIRDTRHLTILLVEHHMGMVMRVCDTVVVLERGQVIASGCPTTIQSNPDVIAAYLGEL